MLNPRTSGWVTLIDNDERNWGENVVKALLVVSREPSQPMLYRVPNFSVCSTPKVLRTRSSDVMSPWPPARKLLFGESVLVLCSVFVKVGDHAA